MATLRQRLKNTENSRRDTCPGYNEVTEMEVDANGLYSGGYARLEDAPLIKTNESPLSRTRPEERVPMTKSGSYSPWEGDIWSGIVLSYM